MKAISLVIMTLISINGWTFQLDQNIRKKLGARLLREIAVHNLAQKRGNDLNLDKERPVMIPVLVKGYSLESKIDEIATICHNNTGQWATTIIPLNEVLPLAQHQEIEFIQMANPITPLNDEAAKQVGATFVYSGQLPLPKGYTGRNVVIGILDLGIDIQHGDFQNPDGSTRILYLWDQKSTGGTSPTGFPYGREWSKTQIDGGQCTHLDSSGHGSHVTGSAASNGNATGHYQGMAPEADLIVVSLTDYSNGVIDGTNYIYSKAKTLGKDCVINASVGWQTGLHDGTSGECQMLDNLILTQNGRIFCSAAGNEGDNSTHLLYPSGFDSAWTYLYANHIKKIILYARIPNTIQNSVKFSIGVDQSNYNPIRKTGGPIGFKGGTVWRTPKQVLNAGVIEEEIKFNNHHYGKVVFIAETPTESMTGLYIEIEDDDLIWNQIDSTVANLELWRLRIQKGNSNIHVWLGGDNYGFAYPNPVGDGYYVTMDNQSTITIPAVSSNIIAVGASISRHHWTDFKGSTWTSSTPIIVGEIASFSSLGPTADGRIKPDIVAPGLFIISSLSSTAVSLGAIPDLYIVEGQKHSATQGTSLASPIVAGCIALYLEQNPGASAQQVIQAVKSSAKQDGFTGSSLPNNTWGYGKMDIFSMMTQTGITQKNKTPSHVRLLANYPNPFNPITMIGYELPMTSEVELNIVNLRGEKVATLVAGKQPAGNYQIEWNASDFASGLYFYTLHAGKLVKTRKMILLK